MKKKIRNILIVVACWLLIVFQGSGCSDRGAEIHADCFVNGEKLDMLAYLYWHDDSFVEKYEPNYICIPFFELLDKLGQLEIITNSKNGLHAVVHINGREYSLEADDAIHCDIIENGVILVKCAASRLFLDTGPFYIQDYYKLYNDDYDDNTLKYEQVLQALGFNDIALKIDQRTHVVRITASAEPKEEYVEEAENYKIYQMGNLFFCRLYDTDHHVVKKDGPFVREPQVKMIENRLLRVSWQSGTGMGTQQAYYYDICQNRFSQTFESVFDEYGDNIVFCTNKDVIVQNIFDKSAFYLQISEFEKPFSNVAFPFERVCFMDEGKKVSITYLSGEDYLLFTEEKTIEGTG